MSQSVDRYEVKIYVILVTLLLMFAIGFTYLLIRQEQIVSSGAKTKQASPPITLDTSDKIILSASSGNSCSGKSFSVDYRQTNSKDIRTLEASVQSISGDIKVAIAKDRGNFNQETEFIIKGKGYLSKKINLNGAATINFGTLVSGDINEDGQISQKDVDLLNQNLKNTKASLDRYDLNCDGKLDKKDIDIVSANVGKISDR